ncbi:peptidylprolyl isomerase [Arenicella sp. 4NH20-0111]|uniref:peptidylprolyl isomerase n=1 Tax=Arenicella sp. 4NH20-0111 TaxID=3127648 RepID=UPI0033424513
MVRTTEQRMIKTIFISLLLITLSLGSVKAQLPVVDRVLVIVNEDVITQSEFDYRKASIVNDMLAANRAVPEDFDKQLLETMVTDRLQVQEANRRGIEITEQELQNTIARFASQQNLNSVQLKQSIEASGQAFTMFVNTIKDSMTIARFSEYYARTRVVVPDYEIDGWLAVNNLDQDNFEYEIAQILIKGGEEQSDKAHQIRDEIDRGLSFNEAVSTYSESLDAQQGGVIGWRKPDQLPEVFVNAVKDLAVGGVSSVVQSPNGFHILKLLNLKGERTEILQSSVRHILISAESKVAKIQAKKRADEIRQRIVDGEDFEALARIYSDDSVSAASGGSLGWVSPGEMVPPFEEAYKQMPIGAISEPVETRFGMHILRVEERRNKNVSEQMKRAQADNILRRQRADREFGQWVRELLEGAYVKHVAEPV